MGGGGFLGDLVNGITLGLADNLFGGDPKADTSAAEQVAEDKKKNANKRRALYATKGGALGQEVNQVGESSRGNLFGN